MSAHEVSYPICRKFFDGLEVSASDSDLTFSRLAPLVYLSKSISHASCCRQ